MRRSLRVFAFVVIVAGPVRSGLARAADCSITATGRVPVSDLGPGLYLGQFQGGLYPGGANAPPAGHHGAAVARALSIVPRNSAGAPDPSGSYALLSIGMSNTTQEWCCHPGTLMGRAQVDPLVDHVSLEIVNGAAGGQSAATWDMPADANYDRVRDSVLAPRGLTEAQVAAVWVKVANPGPTVGLPAANADAFALEVQIGAIARAVRTRYPNVRLMFLSSRIYAGYASTALNPEPYAYESAFGVKWAIEAQIRQVNGLGVDPQAGDLDPTTSAPLLLWGPYLWADGLAPRADGLTWLCSDLSADGTHPSAAGQSKVGQMLHAFFLASPYSAPWYRADSGDPCPADLDGDGVVGAADLSVMLGSWGGGPGDPADLNGDGAVGPADLAALLGAWGPC